MAGWYSPQGCYHPEELGGLSVTKFAEAVRAEGVTNCWDGGNYCLHTHKLFNDFNLIGTEKPSRIAFSERDVREDDKLCDRSLKIYWFNLPWFKHFDDETREWIEKYAAAFRKVAENYEELLDKNNENVQGGRWFGNDNG